MPSTQNGRLDDGPCGRRFGRVKLNLNVGGGMAGLEIL
jgi:hypothetical protein